MFRSSGLATALEMLDAGASLYQVLRNFDTCGRHSLQGFRPGLTYLERRGFFGGRVNKDNYGCIWQAPRAFRCARFAQFDGRRQLRWPTAACRGPPQLLERYLRGLAPSSAPSRRAGGRDRAHARRAHGLACGGAELAGTPNVFASLNMNKYEYSFLPCRKHPEPCLLLGRESCRAPSRVRDCSTSTASLAPTA